MSESFTTLEKYGKAEVEDRKSQFIGEAMPAKNEEEAIAFLNGIRAKYPDATHHVYAYLLRENQTARYSDDREPQGTAGLPILDAMKKRGITDAIVVVTRYFGGTLLGTGGLVHAYTKSALFALDAAGIVKRTRFAVYRLTTNYVEYQKLQAFLETRKCKIDGSQFSDTVSVDVALPVEEAETVLFDIQSLLCGRVTVDLLGEREDFLPNT